MLEGRSYFVRNPKHNITIPQPMVMAGRKILGPTLRRMTVAGGWKRTYLKIYTGQCPPRSPARWGVKKGKSYGMKKMSEMME